MVKRYTKEMAIQSIRDCYEKNGTITGALYVLERRRPSRGWIIKAFGSWKKAVIEAGLTNQHIDDYSEEKLIQQLRKCADEHDGNISYELYKCSGYKPSVDYITQHFGTWRNALKKAQLRDYKEIKRYTDEEIINALQLCYGRNGKVTKRIYATFAKGRYPSTSRLSERFGTWNEVLKVANIPINKRAEIKITKAKAVKALKACYQENNGKISRELYDKWQTSHKEYPVSISIVARFGSWLEALKGADIDYSNYRYTDEDILGMLADNLNRMNGKFHLSTYLALNMSPSIETFNRRFGSVENALSELKKRKDKKENTPI